MYDSVATLIVFRVINDLHFHVIFCILEINKYIYIYLYAAPPQTNAKGNIGNKQRVNTSTAAYVSIVNTKNRLDIVEAKYGTTEANIVIVCD